MQTPQPLATLTALDLHRAVLRVQGVVVQVHHARQSGGEPHPIRDSSIPIQSNQFVPLGDVVQETDKTLKPSTPTHLPVFVVGEESIRDPDLFGEIPRERQYLFVVAEGQPLVLPVLIEIHRDRVVLKMRERDFLGAA
jgi:hypothetical protein